MSRVDAGVKLRGEAVYGTDLTDPEMLWGALVLAPASCGRIRRLDLTEARRMPGVVAVLGPQEVAALLPNGGGDAERPLFPPAEISYRNQPLAAVAARTRAEARAAARRVRCDIEPDEPVSDLEAVFPEWPTAGAASSARVTAHVLARHGDLEAAFRSADLVLEETYRTSGVHQVALEPHACLARVDGGRWKVQTTTQTPFGTREDAASILGIPEEQLVVEGTWVGGGFGGKGAAFLEPYALVLAAAAGRPVKLQLSHREEFLLGRTTLPTVARIATSVKDGVITGRRVRWLLDTGASLPGRDFATGFAISFLLGPYRLGAFEVEGYAVRTNKPPFGPHRAPLAPQCAFVVESHTDELARRLNVDPVEFRLRHVWKEGDETSLGQKVGPFGLAQALTSAGRVAAEWRASCGPGQGVGVAGGFWSTGTGAGGEATLRLGPDGLVIREGEREIGSGSVEVGLVAVAARTLGLPMGAIRLEYRDTADAPYDTGVFGSRTVGALGQAVEKAARKILATLAERRPGAGAVGLEWSEGEVRVVSGDRRTPLRELLTEEERFAGGLVAGGRHFGAPNHIDDTRVVEGTFYPYQDFVASVCVVQVRVDLETGSVLPERVASFQDVGVAIAPSMVQAQIEGGIVMGLGTALTEEMLWGSDGRLGNPYFLDYRIPTLSEVPPMTVTAIEGFPGAGPFGAKGVGEPPIIPVPAAVANAVAAATGVRVTELPLTGERVARALKLL